MKRDKYPTRTILLVGEMQRETAQQVLNNVPLDPAKPIEVVIREQQRSRKLDQNALMWVVLADIAEQAYVNGRCYSAEVWHEFFKREFLPESYTNGITLEGYKKWDYTPDGRRVLVGSTTKLTTTGFAEYLQQIEAYAANLGVMFHADKRAA